MLILFIIILGTCNVINSQLPARIFQPYKYPFPCFTNENDTWWIEKGKNLKGFVFIKVPKTGSSTLSGITLRIANKHKLPHFKNNTRCSVVYNHHTATEIEVKDRVREKTFLWTFIREPSSQIQSFFFWQWRLKDISPTFDLFKKFVEYTFRGFDSFPQIGYVSHKKLYLKDMARNNATLVQEILDQYDFIGINERFDESLVVLRLLLGLNAGDILYVSSKRNGGYDGGAMGGCKKIPKRVKWPEMEDYVSSYYWKRRYTFSNALYAAANRSLDLTIEKIGRAKFDKALSEHKRLMALVDEKCASTAVFPCSSDGEPQLEASIKNCYKFDYGCGYPCIDTIMKNLKSSRDFAYYRSFRFKN